MLRGAVFFIVTLQAAGTPWQTKDKVTLALSVAGAALSLVTLYLTVLRPAAIRVFLGDFLIVRLTWDGYVFIAPELGLYNAGAEVGTVFKISGKLAGLDADRSIDLRWKEVVGSEECRDSKRTEENLLGIC
jgi:hypothetical protein